MSLSLSLFIILCSPTLFIKVQCGGSVVEYWTQDQEVVGLSLTRGTALCPCAKNLILCLVLVQPRKIHPDMTEKLLTAT